jgi:hypothetical protein
MDAKTGLLMKPLNDFFSKKDNITRIIPIISGETKLSLRIIDWFVTNYSKKNNTTIVSPLSNNQLIVYLSYKNQLKAFSKKQFDPFCRRERIKYAYGKNKEKYLVTTVGQLNFFKWALENGIIEYIETHIEDIEKDMNSNIRKNTKKLSPSASRKVKSKKKRRELSSCAAKFVNKMERKITLDFN